MRVVVLDTETTGLEPERDHRVIEIGGVEIVDRRLTGRRFHTYVDPQRDIDESALEVHGLTREFLADKPTFAGIADDFVAFVRGAELVIHNAAFDVGFLDYELERLPGGARRIADIAAGITDTLRLARDRHPGQRNTLDALCRRYGVDASHREQHGALKDAELLALVWLAMTGGQTALVLDEEREESEQATSLRRLPAGRPRLPVVAPTAGEQAAHAQLLARVAKASGRNPWSEATAPA
jgi:DNA polymerase-3 subunit epsilon